MCTDKNHMLFFWQPKVPCLTIKCSWGGTAWATKFCTAAPNIISIIIAVLSPYIQKMCISWVPANGDVHRSLELWVLHMETALCHHCGTQNMELDPRFLENLWTPECSMPFFNDTVMITHQHDLVYHRSPRLPNSNLCRKTSSPEGCIVPPPSLYRQR